MLVGRLGEGGAVPALGQLLDGRHVHQAVVQVIDNGGHVRLEEHLVGAHRVARQERLALLGHEALDVGQDLIGCLFHGDSRRLQVIEQPGGSVHVTHEVVHVVEGFGGRRDQHVHAGVDNREVAVGHDHGHLNEGVA